MAPVLMNEQVFAETLDGAVELKLLAAIIALGEGDRTSTITRGLRITSVWSPKNFGLPQNTPPSGSVKILAAATLIRRS
jgi:hypothetical protein